MSNITASMVANLREITGMGMMECKKALVEAEGDLKKAEEIIRIKSGAKAGKVAGRTAAEGMVFAYISENSNFASLVEVNCETDFVAKDVSFTNFVQSVAKTIVANKIDNQNLLSDIKLVNFADNIVLEKTVEESRKDLIAKLGENITIRRFKFFTTNSILVSYLHGSKIGVLVDLDKNDTVLGKDIAMHIAAAKPVCVDKDAVDANTIEAERNIYMQQALASGKPTEIVNKMVDGRIQKFLAEITLLGQAFVKNPDLTIAKLLEQKQAKVNKFVMYTVGEGIEKKVVDFASEVAAAAIVNK